MFFTYQLDGERRGEVGASLETEAPRLGQVVTVDVHRERLRPWIHGNSKVSSCSV